MSHGQDTFPIRDGSFDLIVVAGPRVAQAHWPTAGARAISFLAADMGLTVGVYGGEGLTVRGVLPFPTTGGFVLVEDSQGRVHRLEARAIVKISADPVLPDPFPGWFSEGLIGLPTARRLRRQCEVLWDPATVILGTGNKALRFASELLESGVPEVICVETFQRWGAKRFAGWEVERRRFEMAGGEIVEARPVALTPKLPLVWEFRVQDSQGVRVIEVSRVVAAGPFGDSSGVREYPSGSFLFELDNTAGETREEDVEGWVMEEERGRYLAGRIVRALVSDLGPRREELDKAYNRARGRLKRYLRHREQPFTPSYQGKWISVVDARKMRSFPGAPQAEHRKRPVASVECFEEIPCNLCESACPEEAIRIGKVPRGREKILDESRCTGCGACLNACPSGAIVVLGEREERSLSSLTLSWRGPRPWKAGEFAGLVNRRGESLGSARVSEVDPASRLVRLEIPSHLAWEARSIRHLRGAAVAADDDGYLTAVERSARAEHRVEITLNGEKRLVRDKIPLSAALFETGRNRPDDALFCVDASCGLCEVSVDGIKRRACAVKVHRGMAVRLDDREEVAARAEPSANSSPNSSGNSSANSSSGSVLCPCEGITREQVIARLRQGNLRSPEAILSVLHVGEGKCHGQLCMSAFRRILSEEGLDVSSWIDWRFPWSEWVLGDN